MTPQVGRRFTERGGWWVLVQGVLMALVLALGPLAAGTPAGTALRAAAWVLFGLSALFGIGGVAVLRGNRTIFPRPRQGSRLVQEGVYRWVRHPLYTSLMLFAGGWSLAWRSWPTAISSLALTAFLYLKAMQEETWLRIEFPGYDAYCERVKRFIPGIL